MFIKIVCNKVTKSEDGVIRTSSVFNEHIYDCNHATFIYSEDVTHLVIEFNKAGPEGFDRTLTFPNKSPHEVFEIFLMNDNGKTVDRYIVG